MSRRTTRVAPTSAFRHRNYRLFFAGQADLACRDVDAAVAQAWLVLQLTSDPALAGRGRRRPVHPGPDLRACSPGSLPTSLPKRKTLVATQAVEDGLSTILAILAFSDTATIPSG